nr:hypothetical protein [Tanacetum cinerariifolium]
VEESGVDELELGKMELDKLVLDKLEVGFDLVPLRVVIPFIFSFGVVIMLPESVPEPEDEAVEESGVDEPELGKMELDKLVLDKLEVGFDLG